MATPPSAGAKRAQPSAPLAPKPATALDGGAFTATLAATHSIDGISAASGLEISADGLTAYVPGDDSVWLSVLSLAPGAEMTKVQRRLRLTASRDVEPSTGLVRSEVGIPKKVKPDFEAIAALPWTDDDGNADGERIAVFGSASKAGLRDGIVLLNPATGDTREYEGASLMDALRGDARVTGAVKLNLEAAALVGGRALALFQRGNVPGGCNAVALFDLAAFRGYIAALDGCVTSDAAAAVAAPAYRVVHLELPPITELDGERRSFPAGVSSASTLTLPLTAAAAAAGGSDEDAKSHEEFLILAASYEATLNEIDDGPVLGSRVALLPSRRLLALASDASGAAAVPSIDLTKLTALILPPSDGSSGSGGGGGDGSSSGAPVLTKVEGIAARGYQCGFGASASGPTCGALPWSEPAHVIDALAVTDPDGEGSEMLEVRVVAPVRLLREAAGVGEA